MGASADCRAHTVNWRDRALAAEKQLATLQQTVDAIVKERDALRGKVARVRDLHSDLLAHSKGAAVSTSLIWTNHAFSVVAKDLAAILNDKETP